MATDKQIAANRRNALRSSGPKSANGKARSRHNAATHGLYSQSSVLCNESRSDYDELIQAFIAKFEDAHPDIQIQREWIPRAEMHAKQLALAATGQIGDTVRINVAPLVSELQLKGVLHDLNSLYEGDQQWTGNDLKQFWPGNIAKFSKSFKIALETMQMTANINS